MRSHRDVATPEEKVIQAKNAICSICERPTRGRWIEVKGLRVRAPMRHKIDFQEYCVGSYRPAVIPD